ncbi:MAG: hypothetical protein II399_06855 [Lachnospiraceae bacterium]|nr:hypothetical protein [Lachnospiraceae bacterium]
MDYLLMHKNIEVAVVNDDGGKYNIVSVINSSHLPLACQSFREDDFWFQSRFSTWLDTRCIPYSRDKADELRKHIGHFPRYIVEHLGLALTDCYWFKPLGSPLTWEEVNLRDNGFDDVIGKFMVFDEKPDVLITDRSPDITTNGVLPKMWIKSDEGIFLVKGSAPNHGFRTGIESMNEIFVSELCKLLGVPAVSYRGMEMKGSNEILCYSKLFLNSSNEEYVPLLDYEFANAIAPNTGLPVFRNMKDANGKPVANEVMKLAALDRIIANMDRHSGNIGIIRDADTLQILRLAPNFDCGFSCQLDEKTHALTQYIPKLVGMPTQFEHGVINENVRTADIMKLFLNISADSYSREEAIIIATGIARNYYNIVNEINMDRADRTDERVRS